MSMSDDPRGFRRGQPGNRDYPPSQQGRGGGGHPSAPVDNRYDRLRQPPGAPTAPEKPQPSFSAYKPEAFAKPDRRGPPRPEHDWDDLGRNAPPAPPPSRGPAPPPFPRTPQQHGHDPYYNGGPAADPYAPPPAGGYDPDWQREPYPNGNAPQFPAYYPPHDETPPNGPDLQSVHDRFFAPEPEPQRAPPPPQPPRFGGYDDRGFGGDQTPSYGSQPAPGFEAEPAQRHHGVHTMNSGFDDQQDADWDGYNQPPAPSSVRPFHAPAPIADDDLDADFFADEDDYDADDYGPQRGGGRKRLMAAVLLGAIVTGGGLAYVYKSTNGEGGRGVPSLISADNRPVKEQPADPGGRDFPNGNKLIYDRLSSDGPTSGGPSSPARLAGGDGSSGPDRATAGVVTTGGGGGTLEERIENALKAQKTDEPQTASNGSPDAPRTVRTMTFGPDGSQQPVNAKVQRIPAGNPAPDNLAAGVVVTTEPTAAPRVANPIPSPETSIEPAAQPQQQPRPARVASAAQQAPQITESAGGTGAYFVQIAARNDQAAAIAAFASLQQKYASVLGNYSPSVRKVDLGDKGVWFRLLVGPVENKGTADQLCEKLKGAGMKGCFARKD